MKTETPKQIAERVVEQMFTNGAKSKANRLVLVQENQSGAARIENAANLGGWGRAPLIDFIEDTIKAEREHCAQKAERARLPRGYQWGHDAMEQFKFGKERAAKAIRGKD